MLSKHEMNIVEMQVNKYQASELEEMKKNWFAEGLRASKNMNDLISAMQSYSQAEHEVFAAAEHLVFIDQRIEQKNSWFFRTKRRVHYVNLFRKNLR
jgi:hypothetical protein|tara:strand:- start:344 stop:634 length:291 start_codon:yes stop_codon:yes gene_type:complete